MHKIERPCPWLQGACGLGEGPGGPHTVEPERRALIQR